MVLTSGCITPDGTCKLHNSIQMRIQLHNGEWKVLMKECHMCSFESMIFSKRRNKTSQCKMQTLQSRGSNSGRREISLAEQNEIRVDNSSKNAAVHRGRATKTFSQICLGKDEAIIGSKDVRNRSSTKYFVACTREEVKNDARFVVPRGDERLIESQQGVSRKSDGGNICTHENEKTTRRCLENVGRCCGLDSSASRRHTVGTTVQKGEVRHSMSHNTTTEERHPLFDHCDFELDLSYDEVVDGGLSDYINCFNDIHLVKRDKDDREAHGRNGSQCLLSRSVRQKVGRRSTAPCVSVFSNSIVNRRNHLSIDSEASENTQSPAKVEFDKEGRCVRHAHVRLCKREGDGWKVIMPSCYECCFEEVQRLKNEYCQISKNENNSSKSSCDANGWGDECSVETASCTLSVSSGGSSSDSSSNLIRKGTRRSSITFSPHDEIIYYA